MYNFYRLIFVTPQETETVVKNPLFNVINLAPSGSGMTSSLLSLIIQCRRPELEQKKAQLEKEKHALEVSLRDLEGEHFKTLKSIVSCLKSWYEADKHA